jgi:hypothetical protein
MARTDQNKNKNTKAAAVGGLIAGAKKHYPKGTEEITLGGVSMTVDGITTQLQKIAVNRAAVVEAQAIAQAKVDAEDAEATALDALLSEFLAFVKVTYRGKADALSDFGIKPPKARTPLTVEQKTVAAAKRKATRAARGTQGRKAKQAVHGNVSVKVTVTPDTTTTPATPAAPALTQGTAGGGTTPHS